MTEARITREEMVEMFGSEMPIEAIQLMWNAPPEMTLGEIRSRLRLLAAERAALAPAADDEIDAIRGRHEAARDEPETWTTSHAWAHNDRATLLLHVARLTAELEAERGRRVEVENAARQLLNGASGHYMNAEDRWCLESLLGFYDEEPATQHEDTP